MMHPWISTGWPDTPPVMPDDHECGTFCNEETGIHCELMWTNTKEPIITQQYLARLYAKEYGMVVIDVEQSREAPDYDSLHPEEVEIFHIKPLGVIAKTVGLVRHLTVRKMPQPEFPWLVYFGSPADVKDAYELGG